MISEICLPHRYISFIAWRKKCERKTEEVLKLEDFIVFFQIYYSLQYRKWMNAMANETREQRIVGMQTQNAQYEGVIDVKRN